MNESQPQVQKKGWWGRNWKWVVPVGCLGLLVLFVAFASAIVFLVFGIMKSSDAYKDAVAQAKVHPAVQESLGQPIEEGLFVTGNINVNGSSGHANLAIPISGSKGKGTLYVEATKSAGQWTFATLTVEIREGRERIDMLGAEEPNPQMEPEP